MIKFEETEVVGWRHAIRGMRNAKNSWDKSDSGECNMSGSYQCENCKRGDSDFCIGPEDHKRTMQLRNAGSPDHRKFLRMIVVYVDITAPLYWWKEFDTYKVGTVANSCSTMHTIHEKEFTLDDFSCEHMTGESIATLEDTIIMLNMWRRRYLVACKTEPETGLSAKDIWWQMIQLLPSSYNQKRTVMMNYEVLANIHHSRGNFHKLDEWSKGMYEWYCGLPHSELITGKEVGE